MKHLFILLVLSGFISSSYAQNLVSNYSFEEADSCPTHLNASSYEYSLGCLGWGQATGGTADYYNGCDTAAISIGYLAPLVGVPMNIWGYQDAFEGWLIPELQCTIRGFLITKNI